MSMLYIHQTSCISPQHTFNELNLEALHPAEGTRLSAIEPTYNGIPPGVLRRMSKAVRMGVGTAISILSPAINGIVIGTANAGMEDCFYFLKQIIEYEEGLLTPGNFVQSTPNALAAQLAMLGRNNGYNITHVQLGLAFENALMDAAMLLGENPSHQYLLGAVDDISSYNHALNELAGWYKTGQVSSGELYTAGGPGTIAGEGSAMFRVSANPLDAVAVVKAVSTLHSSDDAAVRQHLVEFLGKHTNKAAPVDLLISGENGDSRLVNFYSDCENILGETIAVLRFKHMCGEYPTASAFALWLACYLLQKKGLPSHMIKKSPVPQDYKNILIYNNHKGAQHSLVLVAIPGELPG